MKQKNIKKWLARLLIFSLLISLPLGCGKSVPPAVNAPVDEQTERQSGTLTKENTRVGSDRLALDLGQFPLAGDAGCEIKAVEVPSPLDGIEIKAYSFAIDTDEELLSVLKLTMPYGETALVGQSVQGSVGAAYYNDSTGEWEPVPFTINEQAGTVTVYADHLSIYGCFEIVNENTRKAYAAYAIPALAKAGVNGASANAVITASVGNSGNPGAGAVEAGLSALDLGLSLGGAAVEAAGHISGALGSDGAAASSLLGELNDHLGDLGLLCSIAQVSQGMYNIYNGDTEAIFPCYANALKTGIGYTAGKMGAQLYSLASLGTLVIEYSLNKFAETAWTGRQDIYEKAYALYYESDGVKRDARAWAKLFIEAKQGASSAERYRLRIEGLVQQYADQFWQDELNVATYQAEAQKHGFTGGGGLNEKMKEDISNRYRNELFRTVIQNAFKLIAEKESTAAERALLKKLNAVRNELNKTSTVELVDTTLDADKPDSGCTGWAAYVDVPNTVTDAQSWSTTLDAKGKGKISFSVLGYLMAGAPNTLKLYKPDSPPSGAPDLTVPFQAAVPSTVAEYQSPDAEEKKPPETKPEKPAAAKPEPTQPTQPQQPEVSKYAWVLVETVTNKEQSEVDHTNKGGVYQITASASPGSYTYSSKYVGETDTYPEPDQIHGEGYAMKLDISVPPKVIQAGQTVSLDFKLAFTAQNISYFDGNGSCRADLNNTRFANKNGKSFFEIYCSVKYSQKNVLSVSDTITAKAPGSGKEGEKMKIWTGGPGLKLGTTYVYEWKKQ